MWYQTGTVTTVNGSASVVGVGTAWLGQVSAGDLFTIDRVTFYKVAMVGGDGNLTLATPYGGASAAGQIYGIVLNFETASVNFLSAAVALLTPNDRVTAVFGRSGAVTAQAGDYAAAQVTVMPAGGIAATEVQGALAELDTEKAALAGATFTGTVTLASGTVTVPPLVLQTGALLGVPAQGVVEFDGLKAYLTVGACDPSRKTLAFLDSDITGTATNVSGIVAIEHGGTGATTATAALANLGAAPLNSPALTGLPTAPTPAAADSSSQLATTAYVKSQGYITVAGAPVQSVAGKTGVVTLTVADVSGAAPLVSPVFSGTPTGPTPSAGDSSGQLATTAFVKGLGYITLAEAPVQSVAGKTGAVTLAVADVSGAAPLASPSFSGTPTGPTAGSGDSSNQLATTAFVKGLGYITAAGAPVQSVAGKTGAVTLVVGDVVGAAPLASPSFTGLPVGPTAATGDSSSQLATTAFVKNQGYVTAGTAPVLSVAGKTGNVTLAVADVSGAAPLASPALSGTPTAPTRAASDNSTAIATTAFVKSQNSVSLATAYAAALCF